MSALATWEPGAGSLGRDNCVLVARSRRHFVHEFPGPLSIKTVTSGRVAWRIDRQDVWVDPSTFLLLNDQQPYSMTIDAAQPVTTCCVFFRRGFVEEVFRQLTASEEQQLDEPCERARDLLFLSRLRPRSTRLAQQMAGIEILASSGCPGIALDERYLEIAAELLAQAEESRAQIARLDAVRAATRAELLVRVSRGREYLHAWTDGPLRLDDAARAAGMSAFHFHRSFRRAFGISPSRYAAERRFARAVSLLKSGENVTEAALAAGFLSPASFSTAFSRRFGVPPSGFAAQFRKKSNAQRASGG